MVAIFTLAIGIGANTAIFSITEAVLLRPLPYPDPKGLIRIWQAMPRMGEGHLGTAPPEFAEYRDRTRIFASVAGYQTASFDLSGDSGEAEHISGYAVTENLFPTLAVKPFLGQVFGISGRATLLSYQFWRTHYSEDPHIVGKIIRLNERPYQIVGVMPRGFTFPSTAASPGEPPALWTPLQFNSKELNNWASSFDTAVIARTRPGVSLAQAQDDVKRVARQFQQEHAGIYSGNTRLEATAEQWAPNFGAGTRVALLMLSAAIGFVLLVACANLANMLLARAGARQREMSIRRALGASASRLTCQVLTETALLTLAGSATGCALAYGLCAG